MAVATGVSGSAQLQREAAMPTAVTIEAIQNSSKHRRTKTSSAVLASGSSHPTLTTARSEFRPFMLSDIGPLAALAGKHRIADTTIGVPHPYTTEFARMWISSHSTAWERRRALHWAALKSGEDRIVGYAGLNVIDTERSQAELRFWVGCGVERNSDATEWSAAIVDFALTSLNMNRIYAPTGRSRAGCRRHAA